MNVTETKRYEMLVRLNQFGKDHGTLFPETTQARQHFADIADAVKQLSGYAVEKMRAGDEAKSRKTAGRLALSARLRAISRTARLIAADNPGMEDTFNFPDPQTDQALVTAGRMFAENAEAFTKAFIGQGMPTTFIADLRELVDRFEEAINARSAGDATHAAARASIAKALASGTAAAQKLDAMVANHLQDDPVIVTLWRHDRRVGHPHRQRTRSTAPEPPVGAPSPTAPPPAAAASAPASDAHVEQRATSDQKVA